MKSVRIIWVPQLVASVALLWAIYPGNPYGYYLLLRWICCGIFAFLAWMAFRQRLEGWVWILGACAVIYNPILRIGLSREVWSVINVVTIGVAVASVFWVKREADNDESSAS